MEKNRTTVVIDGREYPVASVESVEHIQQVAKLVDDKVREIRIQQSVLNPDSAHMLPLLSGIRRSFPGRQW